MNVFDAIEQRRATKAFDPTVKMTDNEITKLLDAARLSPTAFNQQNWRFVVVQDSEQRAKIKDAAWGQTQVTDAALLIILCADTKAWSKNPERYWRNTPQEVQNVIIPMMQNFYTGREWMQRDEAIRSTGIAAQTIMLAAKAMGYDSAPMDGFDPDAVGKIINLPEDHVISMMIAVGKSAAEPRPRTGPLDPKDVIVYDRFAA